MQIVTIDEVKYQLNITHTAQDARLASITTRLENVILKRCGLADMDAFYAEFGDDEATLGALKEAVLHAVSIRFQSSTDSIWKDGLLSQLLMPFALPAFSFGSSD